MKKRAVPSLLLLCILGYGGALQSGCVGVSAPAGHLEIASRSEISLADYSRTLPSQAILVGFDVDDTILFSSPGHQFGRTKYGPDYDGSEAFWEEMSTTLDAFSTPKWFGRQLVAMHKSRGDAMVFITRRPRTPGSESLLAERIGNWFGVKNARVIFTDRGSKTPAMISEHIVVYYGDSDSDMIDALAAGVKPVRVKRSAGSLDPSPHHNGQFGELVLQGSSD